MVDAVGGVTAASDLRIVTTGRASTAPAATPAATGSAASIAPGLTGVASAMAAAPPVDEDRVAEIKQAIANGTYPILPETVADRLIALSLDWK